MRLGLLEAEILPAKVVTDFGGYGNMFEKLLAPLLPAWSFHYYAVEQGQFPPHIHACDAYLVTGSRFSAYDQENWIKALKEFVRSLQQNYVPCVGICFGHQLIAEALGGKVIKNAAGWGIGKAEFKICQHPHWMTEKVEKFTIRVSHQDQVVKLPAEAELFASNHFCPIGGFTVGSHIFCLQGHPEFNDAYLVRLVNKRRNTIGGEKSDKALISIEKTHQDPMPASFLRDFFRHHEPASNSLCSN